MNHCILMAEIIQAPELRYTSDTQTPITEMMVQFPSFKADEPPATLKVVGWGNLAQEMQQRYREGDRIVIEGRLTMNTLERPEGFKEKQAELTVQRIHRLHPDALWETQSGLSVPPTQPPSQPINPTPSRAPKSPSAKTQPAEFQTQPNPEPNLDEIPF